MILTLPCWSIIKTSAVPAIFDTSSNKTTWDITIAPFILMLSIILPKVSNVFFICSLDILLVSTAANDFSKSYPAITPSNNVSTSLPISKLIWCSTCFAGDNLPLIAVVTDVYTFSLSWELM